MPINQQWVRHISGDNRQLVNIDIVDIINQSDALSLGGVCRFDNPDVLFAIMLLQLLVVLVELSKFIRKNVRVRHKVKVLLAVPLLHPNNIEAKSIFTRDLMTLREMVDLLVLVQALIQVALAT